MISLSSRATAGRAQVSWMKRHSLLKPHHGGTIGRTRHALMEWWSIFASFHVRTELWQLHAKAQLRVDANCGSNTQSHPPPSNDDSLWLGSSKIARSDLVGL